MSRIAKVKQHCNPPDVIEEEALSKVKPSLQTKNVNSNLHLDSEEDEDLEASGSETESEETHRN